MTTCTRCGLRFWEFGTRGTTDGLCGICRIELRAPDGRRVHMLEFGNAYAAANGLAPVRERPR